MGLVSRYILRQIWTPSLLASVVISVFVIGAAVQEQLGMLMSEVPVVQITMGDVTRLSLYALPTLIGFILPITFLMGIMLTFARMAQYGELDALKASGVPLKRAALPVLLAGVLLSGLVYFAMDIAQPWAYKRIGHMLSRDLPLRVSLDMLPTGVMHEYAGWRVYIGEREGPGRFRDIVVLQAQEDGKAAAFYARQGGLEARGDGGSDLVLQEGYYIPADDGGRVTRVSFDALRKPVPRLEPGPNHYRREAMSMEALFSAERESARIVAETQSLPEMAELRSYRISIGERLSFPMMCLAVSVVAAPIGARTKRRGRTSAFLAGLIIVGVYFVVRKAVEPPYVPGLAEAILIAQAPNLLLFAAGGLLFWRVDRV